MDHKQRGIIYATIIKMLIVIYIVVFVVGIVKLFRGYSPQDCFWELLVIFLMPVIGFFFLRSRRKAYFPTGIAGCEVSPEQTMKALTGRIKAYLLDSLQYAIVIVVLLSAMDLWDCYSDGSLFRFGTKDWLDVFIRMLARFVGFCSAYFAIDFIIYESQAKKYLRQQRRREKRESEYREIMGECGHSSDSTDEAKKETDEND